MSFDDNSKMVFREVLGPARQSYGRNELESLLRAKGAQLIARLPFPRRHDISYEARLCAENDQLVLEVHVVIAAQRALPLDAFSARAPEDALRAELDDLPDRIIDEYMVFLEEAAGAEVSEKTARMHRLVRMTGGSEVNIPLPGGGLNLLLPDPPAPEQGETAEFHARVSTVSRDNVQVSAMYEMLDADRPFRHRDKHLYALKLGDCAADVQKMVRRAAVDDINEEGPGFRFWAVPFRRRGSRSILFLKYVERFMTAADSQCGEKVQAP